MNDVKTIVLEGSDGVGKTTLAKELARQLSQIPNIEAFYMNFPSNSVEGARDFYLKQSYCTPKLENNAVSWEVDERAAMCAMRNLLYVLSDFAYTYHALDRSSDITAVRRRGNQPVLVIDREILSSVAYQILYPVPTMRRDLEHVKEYQYRLFDCMATAHDAIFSGQHTMLLHMKPSNGAIKLDAVNAFDNYDQARLQKHFADVYRVARNPDDVPDSLSFLRGQKHQFWLNQKFTTYQEIQAFSKPVEQLAADIVKEFTAYHVTPITK